jgi:hypothetical protein
MDDHVRNVLGGDEAGILSSPCPDICRATECYSQRLGPVARHARLRHLWRLATDFGGKNLARDMIE